MGYGRRQEEWIRWAKWFSIYSEAHGVKKNPNSFLPPDLKVKEAKPEMPPKMTIRQLAAMQGHPIGGDNGSRVSGH